MIRALIVDDEAPARRRLAKLLGNYPNIEIVGEAVDGLTALAEIERLKPDVVFLDIDMPELDGFGVARALTSEVPILVFVTAYDEYALRAFETTAIDYLLKPVEKSRLESTLRKIEQSRKIADPGQLAKLLATMNSARPAQRMAIRSGAKFVVINPERISAILAEDHYATVHVEGRELLVDESLDVLLSRLDASRFLRVHRGAIINLDFLSELSHEGDRKYAALLSDSKKTSVPISRDRLPALQARLGMT